MKRVAYLINFEHKKWLGGYNLIKNLILIIKKYSNNKIIPVLIVKKNFKSKDLVDYKNIEIIKTNFFSNHSKLQKFIYKIQAIIQGRCINYEKFFKDKNIDVLSHINVYSNNLILGKKSAVKTLSLIADFQHHYLPENFSFRQRILRNLNIYLSCFFSSKILLLSKDGQKDLKKISKKGFHNSSISRSIFVPPQKKEIINLKLLKKKFNFNSNYFFLPNHYWKHKNHKLVLDSLNFLKKKNRLGNILVLSTGSKDDQKGFEIFKKLMEFNKFNNLEKNYRYLGVVSNIELMSLMFHSVAVINPSEFEGRSSTVEQAKSLGKQIILSNIKIHKEQKPENAKYFKVDDYKALSIIIENQWYLFDKNKDLKKIDKAYLKFEKNLFKYFLEYKRIINSLFI